MSGFFPLGDDAWILLASVMGMRTEYGVYQPVMYYIGEWKNEKFTVNRRESCDFGCNFYAPQTLEHEGVESCLPGSVTGKENRSRHDMAYMEDLHYQENCQSEKEGFIKGRLRKSTGCKGNCCSGRMAERQ